MAQRPTFAGFIPMSAFALLALLTALTAVAVPTVVWYIGRRNGYYPPADPVDQQRARALPYIGNGVIPPERDRSVDEDQQHFTAIVRLILKAWPYVRPQLLGRWYVPGKGTEDAVADTVAAAGFSFALAPILATGAAAGGLLFGLVPAHFVYPYGFLHAAVLVMVVGVWLLAFVRVGAGAQGAIAVAVTVGGFAALLLGALVIEGHGATLHAVLVTAACIAGWMVQFRFVGTQVLWRFRAHAHLAYFYLLIGAQGFMALTVGLIIADLLNQSLLQSQPAMPALAEFFGRPEWARGAIETLDADQRHAMKWWYVVLGLGFWAASLPAAILLPYYNIWILQRINQDLRLALVERWQQLSLTYHGGHRTGDSIFRIYQDSAQVTVVLGQISTILQHVWGYLLALALLAFLSPTLGFIATTIVIPGLLLARWAMPRMRTKSLVARATTSDLTARIQETFASIRLIKAYGADARAQKALEADSIVAFNATFRVRLMIALVTILMYTIAASVMISGEYYMALQANHGDATFADELIALIGFSFVVWNLGAFNWAKGQLHGSADAARGIMRQWLSAQDVAMGLHRVFDILALEAEVRDVADAVPLDRLQHGIRFDNVHFHYQPDRPVLAGVSFNAAPGTVTAIVGPTGSGKSTLMSLLLRLYDPTGGSITIDDRDLRGYRVDSLRHRIAIALQENVLFALSVRDNIRYVAPDADVTAVRNAIEVACMDDYVDGLPEGLDTVLGDRGGKLSTGQRQRLSIARAIVRDPPILILDEPTAALDAATEHRVLERLARWGQQRVIFLITHRISTIRRADNILYLEGGRIVEAGTHAELMQLPNGRYRDFVETESALSHNQVVKGNV